MPSEFNMERTEFNLDTFQQILEAMDDYHILPWLKNSDDGDGTTVDMNGDNCRIGRTTNRSTFVTPVGQSEMVPPAGPAAPGHTGTPPPHGSDVVNSHRAPEIIRPLTPD